MRVLVFKTNIRYKKEVRSLTGYLDKLPGLHRWNVDLHDTDKVLRIETSQLEPENITQVIHTAGYKCEELPD
jgi:copper chaperone